MQKTHGSALRVATYGGLGFLSALKAVVSRTR
jgi:hypothetical protein